MTFSKFILLVGPLLCKHDPSCYLELECNYWRWKTLSGQLSSISRVIISPHLISELWSSCLLLITSNAIISTLVLTSAITTLRLKTLCGALSSPQPYRVELQTKVREDFTIMEKALSWLKAPTSRGLFRFFVIVKSSRTFVWSSTIEVSLCFTPGNPSPRLCRGRCPYFRSALIMSSII